MKSDTKTQEQYILDAKSVHGETYDYSKLIYLGANKKVEIICSTHASFWQKASSHLSGYGCKKCASIQMGIKNRSTTKCFVDRSEIIHKCFYDYSKSIYIDNQTKLTITCPIHGDFKQTPNRHLDGAGCYWCGRESTSKINVKTQELFLLQAKIKHGCFYDYSEVEYVRASDKIKINCPIHGYFMQTPMGHLRGNKCPRCSSENSSFIRSQWVKKARDRVGTFYIIRCFNASESFYKFGITFTGVSARYKHGYCMPYNYEIIRLVISSDKEYIWNLEKRFSRLKQKDRYSPQIPFQGSKYECISSYTYIERTR